MNILGVAFFLIIGWLIGQWWGVLVAVIIIGLINSAVEDHSLNVEEYVDQRVEEEVENRLKRHDFDDYDDDEDYDY